MLYIFYITGLLENALSTKKNKEMVSLRKRNSKYVFFTEEIYNPFAQSLNRPFSEQNKVLCKTGLIFQR